MEEDPAPFFTLNLRRFDKRPSFYGFQEHPRYKLSNESTYFSSFLSLGFEVELEGPPIFPSV